MTPRYIPAMALCVPWTFRGVSGRTSEVEIRLPIPSIKEASSVGEIGSEPITTTHAETKDG